tara:strand:- start:242 stop:1684 length:1443 start_codon:yes stop_codon:yes gene_type:complete
MNGLAYRDWETLNDRQHDIFTNNLFLDGECATSVDDYVKGAVNSCGCPDTEEELHHHSPVLMREIEKQQDMLPDMKVKIGESLDNLNETIDLLLENIMLSEISAPTFGLGMDLPDFDGGLQPNQFDVEFSESAIAAAQAAFQTFDPPEDAAPPTPADTKATTSERQERAFVDTVNGLVKEGGAINVAFGGNDVILKGITNAGKVEGRAPNGNEPYIDVILSTKSGDESISMKGLSSPSLGSGGASGIEKILPGFLRDVIPPVVERFKEAGVKDGSWIAKGKTRKRILELMQVWAQKNYPDSQVVLVYPSEGKEVDLFSVDPGNAATYPDYLGATSVKERPDGTIAIINNTTADAVSPQDSYFVIEDQKILRRLLAGDEHMGGPIDYVYVGPMDFNSSFDPETRTLLVEGAKLFTIDAMIEEYDNIYLRVRKRRIDNPFDSEKQHSILGKAMFGKGFWSRESGARIVLSPTVPKRGPVGAI